MTCNDCDPWHEQQLKKELEQAKDTIEMLVGVMAELSAFAVGEGDVCEIIARRLRAAMDKVPDEMLTR